MKTYVLFTLLLCHLFIPLPAKIINGYSMDIHSAEASLKHLSHLPTDRNVMMRLERVRTFILYYNLTEILLQQFKQVAPDLYHQIDTIRDYKGRAVDVYVKFVPHSEMQAGARATTNINQAEGDKHAYVSPYGNLTVSIEILTVAHSLLILAHEFGHVSYQVPNLNTYVAFFKRSYTDQHMKANYLGHKPNDPSGQTADLFENLFRSANAIFVKRTKEKPVSPVLVRDQIAKGVM